MLLEAVYDRVPPIVQNWMISAKGFQLHRRRYRSRAFQPVCEALLENEKLQLSDLLLLQLRELKKFLQHCYCRSPYYRKLFVSHAISPNDLRSLDDLPRYPITSRQEMRNRFEEFLTRSVSSEMTRVHTSGTTGSPLTIYYSREDLLSRHAFLERCRRWAGVHIGQRRASFSGHNIIPQRQLKGPYWRFNYFGNQLLCSSYHLSSHTLNAYVDAIANFNPDIIDGYPSAIHILADHILRTGVVRKIAPKAVMVTAETLFPHQRCTIESAFHCKVYNQYASSDGAPFISECKLGRLHVHLDSGVIEILRPDGSAAGAGECGELIVTSFTTRLVPMFRFSMGDMAVVANDSSCNCGLPFPIIEQVLGRVDDLLYTPERGYVGRMDTVFKGLPSSIVEAQIEQLDAVQFVVRLVPDKHKYLAEHGEHLIQQIKRRLGLNISIKLDIRDSIPRSKAGKLRAVVNSCADFVGSGKHYSGEHGVQSKAEKQSFEQHCYS
jgi:phenylacetate-CoA ligase